MATGWPAILNIAASLVRAGWRGVALVLKNGFLSAPSRPVTAEEGETGGKEGRSPGQG
jgi:hypothetical protein